MLFNELFDNFLLLLVPNEIEADDQLIFFKI